jgi:hypothetical protein
MPATGDCVWVMFETLCPASLANPEKVELPPSTQREMGWRAELPPVKVPVNPHRLDAARIPATAPELSKRASVPPGFAFAVPPVSTTKKFNFHWHKMMKKMMDKHRLGCYFFTISSDEKICENPLSFFVSVQPARLFHPASH